MTRIVCGVLMRVSILIIWDCCVLQTFINSAVASLCGCQVRSFQFFGWTCENIWRPQGIVDVSFTNDSKNCSVISSGATLSAVALEVAWSDKARNRCVISNGAPHSAVALEVGWSGKARNCCVEVAVLLI